MLDDIIPTSKPLSRSQMLTAEPELLHVLPEIDTRISFRPLLQYLKEKRSSVSEIRSGFYNYLIEKFESEPALSEPITDLALLQNHDELLELLSTLLFPVVSRDEKNNFALTIPYQFKAFYCSDCFCHMFLDSCREKLLLPANMDIEQLKAVQCSMIYEQVLEKYYNIKLNDTPQLVYPITDLQTGLKRFYRISYDRRFIDISLKGELPSLKDCAVCLNTFRILDLDQQLKSMPLNLFSIEGFAVWVAEDITTTESLENIKKTLIRQNECDTEVINELKDAVHALVGLNNVTVGLFPFIQINGQYVLEDECVKHSIVGRQFQPAGEEGMNRFQGYINMLYDHPGPLPLTHLDEVIAKEIPFLKPLVEEGYRSYLHYPMLNSDGLLGMLELVSTTPDVLNHEVVTRLEPAMPLLSVAMLKNRNTFHGKIEKIIKEKFTALQRSVEWKFNEVAWDHLRNLSSATSASVKFENVHPLYGAIDIRNSSQERTNAIQKDLKEHLQLIDGTLDQLQVIIPLPLLEGLKFKNFNILQSIMDTMLTEDEIRINEFIEEEVEPVLTHLRKSHPNAQPIVDYYFKTVNNSPLLHQHRQEYEESIATINDAVLEYLEKEEEAIQSTYPHYFERYRTDGVEYNIYIGQSIAPRNPFDLLYLKNIRLWQLRSMAEVARITHRLLPHLKVPLQTTQMILIHSQCITIAFRRDERRFDVEGSYNIRYEIIKKRLDKARIKDLEERLTQPGKIALVYSNQKEAQEYQQYIEFLQNKNILKPGNEFLELEELQGVKGLKAMRVEINMEDT